MGRFYRLQITTAEALVTLVDRIRLNKIIWMTLAAVGISNRMSVVDSVDD